MSTWKELYRKSLTGTEEIASAFDLDSTKTKEVLDRYPALINDYYRQLCIRAGDPLIRQVVPDPEEISHINQNLPEDPIGEETYSPVPNLTHRYRDRVLFLVSDRCPVYCRFCTRKRKVGRTLTVTPATLSDGFRYIGKNSQIRDILLSGGDPLMLENDEINHILEKLNNIAHVEIVRIGTRVPAALPQRITPELISILSNMTPLYIHTHFNHPAEITKDTKMACQLLAEAGIPLSSQTVLLGGINDDLDILERLFRELLKMRVRPYYLFQADMVRGVEHFRTSLLRGLDIMKELHLRTSPMAVPRFVVDLPGGAGKVFPSFNCLFNTGRHDQFFQTPDGVQISYPDP